ncbi:efflux RND transporter periplasmic adaptor subunit [Curtobacterium sp. MCPF17_002]|uniref:HlyD family efflux transporter periplasmic adaptor subunit n=1 Tax=Curtobacterium sp. MCPF17_002 TaxID=2175645 RepID=UPI000DA9FC01|nr:efflux RND transporter periplasmic adaptor subunit [Curtobacterium sp. MCPF17_002]WIB78658.1 efflux RND transporter periplasmic adaptor subunit [Curtobacterium sp. MCPF17_002]
MTVLRRWVWPGLKFLVFAAIAVSLVRLAFFAAQPEGEETVPTGQIADPTVTVEKGDVVNDVEATGTIRSVASTAVRSSVEGTVNKVFVANGAHVEQGAPVIDVRVETPSTGTADDGAPLPPTVTFSTVVATSGGTVSGLDLVTKQPVTIGDTVARVAPEAYRASATLDAAQLYRLTSRPSKATVTVTDGPAPFTCTNLSLTSAAGSDGAASDESADDSGGGSGSSGGTQLECDVPSGVTVFPGLEVTVAVPAGTAEGVLTLPTTAVQGTAQKGVVTVVGEDGARTEKSIVLGLNDGETVEVRSGLAEGDTVLQFVPGKEQTEDDESADGGSVVIG